MYPISIRAITASYSQALESNKPSKWGLFICKSGTSFSKIFLHFIPKFFSRFHFQNFFYICLCPHLAFFFLHFFPHFFLHFFPHFFPRFFPHFVCYFLSTFYMANATTKILAFFSRNFSLCIMLFL